VGCLGEIALSRILKLRRAADSPNVTTGDFSRGLEARATTHASGHLLIYPPDTDEAIFALMVGEYPWFKIAGFFIARDAKRPEWWRGDADPPSFWVPQSRLVELSTAATQLLERSRLKRVP
jgi:hypothetical protein